MPAPSNDKQTDVRMSACWTVNGEFHSDGDGGFDVVVTGCSWRLCDDCSVPAMSWSLSADRQCMRELAVDSRGCGGETKGGH